MKKILITALSSCILLSYAHTGLALSSECPPGEKMKTIALTQASALGYQHRWSLASKTFKENNSDWNLFFIIELPHAQTSAQALEQGKAAFEKATITTLNPKPYNANGMTYCDYAKEAKYVMTAASAINDGLK